MKTIKEIINKEIWEDFLLNCREKTFLQSWNWGDFNKRMGDKIWRLGVYENSELVGVTLVIRVTARRGNFLLLPHAPLLCSGNPKSEIRDSKQIQNSKFQILNIILEELKKIAKEEKVSFLRIAPIWERTEENAQIFRELGFKEAPIHVHPEVTWVLDITPSEENLLAGMRKTTRYLVRNATKDTDVTIEKGQTVEDLKEFDNLYRTTADRHDFTPFSFKYLKNELESFLPDNQVIIFNGRYKNEVVSSAVVIFWQNRAFYHQGASSLKYAKTPVSYLLQWEAIKEAKKRGCTSYNFWGIAPILDKSRIGNSKSPASAPTFAKATVGKKAAAGRQISNSKLQILNPKHPWRGLSLFKIGFGGEPKEYVKTQDFPLSKDYWLTYIFERLRKKKRGF